MTWGPRCLAPALAVLLLAVPSAQGDPARSFDGAWTSGDPDACVPGPATDPNLALRIAQGRLYRVDGGCELVRPVPVDGLPAVVFDLVCYAGNDPLDEAERLLLMHDPDGRLVMLQNYASVLSRCTNMD